ncbi:MAG TPA: thioredoxin domain-containing protein [Acidimicrobiia bacterium]|nr:thioredoxin domain-containing protein [Acidimicrobiia bacterium]
MTGRNRLGEATSPYLLQHRDNPVHWWEWGDDAFAEAASRGVPVLLSVGYASCHWCHVMAHESFEDPDVAAVMNVGFVNVKVDREERPDVDRIYMDAVQAMTRRGGWPMTVFLTPRGEPFYAGTYFPPTDRHGMPSFRRVLETVADAWANRRDEIEATAAALAGSIDIAPPPARGLPTHDTLTAAHDALWGQFDRHEGGFDGAPKFPQAPTLEFLLRAVGRDWAPNAAEMLVTTLHAMDRGGIHDHLGGGFARYSTDEQWLVPHFEKMLYDNALLARLYARAWQVTGVERFAEVARTTIDYLLGDLALPGGGLASGEDADSEGEEGRFYTFDVAEIDRAAGDDAAIVRRAWGVTPEGDFEGRSIVHAAVPLATVAAEFGIDPERVVQALERTKQTLLIVRSSRVRPMLDDKAVCSWNALAARALAEAGTILGDERMIRAAREIARFILTEMRRPDGRLLRSRRGGRGDIPAFADDYAATSLALLALYDATGDPSWYADAAEIATAMVDLFWDPSVGGVFATGTDAERLIARPKNLFDNPTPSDNALAAEAMQHLGALTGDPVWTDRVEDILRLALDVMERFPSGAGHLLSVALVHLAPVHEVAVVGPGRESMIAVVRARYRPEVFLAQGVDGEPVPLLAGRTVIAGEATAYVCRGFVCDAPVTTAAGLAAALP